MDPNINLQQQLRLAGEILHTAETTDGESWDDTDHEILVDVARSAQTLADHVESLNRWIVSGGFKPEAWNQPTYPSVQAYRLAREGATPHYEHDCKVCEFVGIVVHLLSNGDMRTKDVYVCPQGGHPTVVIRQSNDPPDYASSSDFASETSNMGGTWLPGQLRIWCRAKMRKFEADR